MEPPRKRPRLLNPLATQEEQEEDPEEDELLSLPAEVNARRDPNLRLERSRQRAVFKLKSAFESIFERYGRDFEGVGDEVDLRSGRIVVNNGHIEGMRGSDLLVGGGSEDEDEDEGGQDEEGEGEEEGGEMNEEERILQGGREVEVGLGLGLGAVMMPQVMMGPSSGMGMGGGVMLPQMMGSSELAMGGGFGGWPGSMGGQPGLSNMGFGGQMGVNVMFPGEMGPNMMFPGQMGGFNGWPSAFGPHMSLQTSDPTWQAPALPPSYMYGPGTVAVAPKVKKKRISLAAAREDQGDNEDDILLGVSTGDKSRETTETPIKQKLLLPKPPPGTGSEKKKKGPVRRKSKIGVDTSKQAVPKGAETGTAKAPSPQQEDVTMAEEDNTPSKTEAVQPVVETVAAETDPVPTEPEKTAPHTETESTEAPEQKPTVMAVQSRPPTVKDPAPVDDSDLYVYVSDSEHKSARKPRNQSLRVEIVAKMPLDITSFRAITPEQGEAGSPIMLDINAEDGGSAETTAPLTLEEKDANQPERPERPPSPQSEKENKTQLEPPEEVFTRHVVDAEYDFSDEDEPMPRKKQQPLKQAGASRKKDESLLRKTLRKPLSLVASDTGAMSDKPQDAPMPDAGNLDPTDSSLEHQANREDERVAVDLEQPSPQPASSIINRESSIPDSMVQPPQITEVIYTIGNRETPWPKRRRGGPSFRGRDPRGEIPDSDPIGGFSTQEDLDDDMRPPSPSLSFREDDEETTLEIPDSYIEPSSELEIPEEEPPRDHTVPSPTLSSYAPDDEMLGPIASLSLQPQDVEMLDPAPTVFSPPAHETSDSAPALSSQSHDGAITETASSPLPDTPHDDINNMTLEGIDITSSPLIHKPAQRKGDFNLRLSTPSYLATPPRRPRGRPPKAKPTPAAKADTATPFTTSKSTPTAPKPTKTPTSKRPTTTPSTFVKSTTPTVAKPNKTPTSKPPPRSSTSISSTTVKPTKTPITSKRPPVSSSTTKTTTTTTTSVSSTAKRKRRSGVLSLLSDSEDDELDLLSPSASSVRPVVLRSSPASNHVRLFSRVTPRPSYAVKGDDGSG
ncbi:hypothetical protein QBC41DRAFT_343131 [Cercophora samala]|uniref:Uncharacterized protein n=1 Tax=Cercophora samala TaxID=330535 RepID=A0AA39ZLX8_9PEZI|nr:hypothetical protein QBC41DRAFT_343131 [Cercophora samala]